MPRKNHGEPNAKAARGRAARRLGHQFERDVAADLRSCGFPDAMRHLEYQQRHANGVDLENTGNFRVQCKRSAKVFPSPKVLDEIKDEAGTIKLLVSKIDRRPTIVTMYWPDFLRILRQLAHGSEEPIIPEITTEQLDAIES